MDGKKGLLSMSALIWLKEIDYTNKSHEDRTKLIAAAKIAYPNEEDEEEEEES